MGSGNPPPEPRNRATPIRELAEEPRASLNNSYNIILLSHATGANKLKQLTTKHHTLLTLRNTKLTRPPRGSSPLLGNKNGAVPGRPQLPRSQKITTKLYKKSFPWGKNCLSSSTYVLGACHLPWPSRFSGRYVFGRWWFLRATAGARPCATQTFELFSRRFFFFYFDLLIRSLQQKRKKCPRVAA